MVNDSKSAGHPVSGGPLFCGRSKRHPAKSHRVIAALLLFLSSTLIGTLAHANSTSLRAFDKPAAIAHNDYQCATATSSATSSATSPTGAIPTERVTIAGVTDGDTVVLADRRKVRIIGINAAELSKKSERPLKHYADAARDVINQLATEADYLTLVAGDEPKDRYGRTLAHLLLPDGQSLATELLKRGLAAATAVAPNTRCADHNLRIEQTARGQNRGIWQHNNNPWFGQNISTKSIQGFHILKSEVKSVSTKRNRWHIELNNNVRVYANTALLNKADAKALVGKSVEVRGWFGHKDGRVSVSMHHRSNFSIQH